ncbi:MAG: DUF350 domain-containing protein [Elusimicrobia bacterium]|nr:DUF350 domain-containing protein [Elusimicrobiota bacterium]
MIGGTMRDLLNPTHFVAAILYSAIGLLLFLGGFVLVDKCTPYNLWEEIVVKQNRALATVVGAVSIGMCLIIAASLLG